MGSDGGDEGVVEGEEVEGEGVCLIGSTVLRAVVVRRYTQELKREIESVGQSC